jgi:hypothetical protein
MDGSERAIGAAEGAIDPVPERISLASTVDPSGESKLRLIGKQAGPPRYGEDASGSGKRDPSASR